MNSSSKLAKIPGAVWVMLMCASSTGCYVLGSARGQLALMHHREPMARVIDRPTTPPALRTQLLEVTSIRNFASRSLGLPDNGSYRRYADVGRRYVVWNVVVAPEFSVDPREWCFPVVGCVAYRGYFEERAATSFAAKWRRRGYDVDVGGVAAYSTLGHFDDPILNTMLGWNDIELAAIVFHELTHQLLYVAGDASFNEALATTVEEEGVRRWLLAQGRSVDLSRHLEEQGRYLKVIELLRRARGELNALYTSGIDTGSMRAGKAQILARLHRDYSLMAAPWGARAPFRSWFDDDAMNNARLASIATYYDCVPGFERELAAAGGDLEAFYRRVHVLARLDAAARDAAVCGGP